MSLIKRTMKGKEDIQTRKRKLARVEKLLEEKQERLIRRREMLEKKKIQLYEEERKEKAVAVHMLASSGLLSVCSG